MEDPDNEEPAVL